MKGLKKITLVSAIAAISAGAQAELQVLNDSSMSEMTGQAGLTIDVQTEWTIGEFAYQDAGFLLLQNMQQGGATGGLMDNIRLTIDVAGSGAAVGGDAWLSYGFSEVKDFAAVHYLSGNGDVGFLNAAQGSNHLSVAGDTNYTGTSTYDQADAVTGVVTTANIDNEKIYGDGDLKIHFDFTDGWQRGGGLGAFLTGNGTSADGLTTGLSLNSVTFAEAIELTDKAVDYRFTVDAIGIAGSNYQVGTQGQTLTTNLSTGQVNGTNHLTGLDADGTTTLISGLSIRGYLGPEDLHIENNGNGFGGGTGRGDADSKIHWDTYFNITDLDFYTDIAGLQQSNITVNNIRGDLTGIDGNASFGFAHSKLDIYAVKDAVVSAASILTGAVNNNVVGFVDGVALNTKFKGDLDIGATSFGDTGTSVGKLFYTDITSTTNWTISAH